MGAIEKILNLYKETDLDLQEEPPVDVKPIKENLYSPIIIRGSYFEEESQPEQEDELDFDIDDFLCNENTPQKDEGNLGVFLYQAILATIIAIVYTVIATFVTPISENLLATVKSISTNDFSFSETVYNSVATFFTYINEQRPLELNSQIFDIIDEDLSSTDQTHSAPIQPELINITDVTLEEVDNITDDISTLVDEVDVAEDIDEEEIDVELQETLDEEIITTNATIPEAIPIEANEQVLPANVTLTPIIFAGEIVFPISDYYYVTSDFGFRTNPITKVEEFHSAYDLAADQGTNILAVLDATVIDSRLGEDLGNFITLDHGNGLTSLYGHCYELFVKVGDKVKQGDVIATVGSTGTSTGNHLHFGMKMNGIYFDPSYIFTYLND